MGGVRRRVERLLVLLLAWALSASSWGLDDSPFPALIDELLKRFHASSVACEAAVAPALACFVADPGHAANLAEALESYLTEHGGGLQRGPWSSANGTHRVVLTLDDPTWGGVELWLVERPGPRVEGRFEHLPKRRW